MKYIIIKYCNNKYKAYLFNKNSDFKDKYYELYFDDNITVYNKELKSRVNNRIKHFITNKTNVFISLNRFDKKIAYRFFVYNYKYFINNITDDVLINTVKIEMLKLKLNEIYTK